jgi:hypothetical protein
MTAEPTPQDIDNANRRQAIADRFRRQFEDALALAERVLGPGWEPTGYHYLVEKDAEDAARRTNTKPTPSATFITCQNNAGQKQHFRVETMTECDTPEDGFGAMLLEPHPTKRVTWGGKEIALHRYSLCWGWFEPDYRPASAEKLAAARAKREEKAERTWREEVEKQATGSLFPDFVREQAETYRKKGRKR